MADIDETLVEKLAKEIWTRIYKERGVKNPPEYESVEFGDIIKKNCREAAEIITNPVNETGELMVAAGLRRKYVDSAMRRRTLNGLKVRRNG